MRFRPKCLLVLLCLIAGPVSSAQAYVLPAPHVLDLMVQKLGSAKTLEVSQKNFFFDVPAVPGPCAENDPDCSGERPAAEIGSSPGPVTPKPAEILESLRYVFPHAFRTDTRATATERIHLYVGGRSLTLIDGAQIAGPESSFDIYPRLLLHRSRRALKQLLDDYGVTTDNCSLGRSDGRVAFVIGAVYPDLSAPQVWVDKETLLPVRWVVSGAEPGSDTARLEIRYIEWRKQKDVWYPNQIEFVENGSPVRLIQAEHLAANPTFTRDLFDIDALRASARPAALPREEGGRREGLSDIQKTIQEFKRLFE